MTASVISPNVTEKKGFVRSSRGPKEKIKLWSISWLFPQSFHTVTFHISTLSLSFTFPHEALKKLRHFYRAIKYWSNRSDTSGFAYSILGFERQMFKRSGRRRSQNPAWRMQVARYSWMFCCYTSDLQIFWKWQVGESILSGVSLFSFCLDHRLKAALYKNLFIPLPLFTSHSSHDQTQML